MMEAMKRGGASAGGLISKSRMMRALAAVAGGFALVPMLTTTAAFQDMTSLLEGRENHARWQAYFVPAPAGSVEEAKLAFVDADSRDRLPVGSGVRAADGKLFSVDTVRRVYDTPDEARVTRADKGARVLSSTPAGSAPPKAFSAGSILERMSLLDQPSESDERVRSAFAKISTETIDAVTLAMNFQLRGTPDIPPPDEKVMLASLGPAVGDTDALGYAPPSSSPTVRASSLFESILKQQPEAFIPPIGDDDHAWAATPLPASAFSDKEQTCLAQGIYFEARGESVLGQAAVAQVILNRVRNPSFPNTICGVVYQNKNWHNRCQFSFACDGAKERISNKSSWNAAKRVAYQVTKGEIWLNEVGSATHYHASYVRPRWARSMERVDKIGKHVFYRTYNGGW